MTEPRKELRPPRRKPKQPAGLGDGVWKELSTAPSPVAAMAIVTANIAAESPANPNPYVLESTTVLDDIRRHRDHAQAEADRLDADMLSIETRANTDIQAVRARADQEIAARRARRADLQAILDATSAALATAEPRSPVFSAPAADATGPLEATIRTFLVDEPAPEQPQDIPSFLRSSGHRKHVFGSELRPWGELVETPAKAPSRPFDWRRALGRRK